MLNSVGEHIRIIAFTQNKTKQNKHPSSRPLFVLNTRNIFAMIEASYMYPFANVQYFDPIKDAVKSIIQTNSLFTC